jgi:ribosome-associated toxin RatA of RatAB toxin-antitoxin module
MDRSDEVIIDGDIQTIFKLGSEIEYWPELLPHYRSVTILQERGNRYMAEMKASRSGIPVSWSCLQERDPSIPRIFFRHIGGFTKGMEVFWTFNERDDGTVAVRISHDFRKGWPVDAFDRFVSDTIVGDFFVGNIAGRTLNTIKMIAEDERQRSRPESELSEEAAGTAS